MERSEAQEKWVDYLYGELAPSEQAAFEVYLRTDPELSEELRSLQSLRRVYREHLPALQFPASLRSQVLSQVGAKPSWWGAFLGQGFFRPAMVAAFTILLTLGIAYQYRDREAPLAPLAKKAVVPGPPAPMGTGGDLSHQDFLLASQASRLRLPRMNWRPQPRLAGGGLVSLASYGNPTMPQPYGETTGFDIRQIEQDADTAIAQFAHHQAMRMRAMGDFKGAAQELAKLIKKYPTYPHVLVAAAQRIDCLFRIGDMETGRRELSWLGQQSPFLAQNVGQRGGIPPF